MENPFQRHLQKAVEPFVVASQSRYRRSKPMSGPSSLGISDTQSSQSDRITFQCRTDRNDLLAKLLTRFQGCGRVQPRVTL